MDNSVYTTFPKKISLEGKTFIIKDAIIKIPSSGEMILQVTLKPI